MAAVKAPSDLDRGREVRFERHLVEPHEPDERRDFGHLDRPESPPLLGDSRLYPSGERVALGPCESLGEIAHHLWVGVHTRERGEIRLPPPPENEP